MLIGFHRFFVAKSLWSEDFLWQGDFVAKGFCGEGIYPRLSAQRSQDFGAAAQPSGDKSPRHKNPLTTKAPLATKGPLATVGTIPI
jgi:hypothetical protein